MAKAKTTPGPMVSPTVCKKRLEVSKTFSLPTDYIGRVDAFFGQRGSGKTYTAGDTQEEILLACGRFICFDPVRAHKGILFAEKVEGVTDLNITDAIYWADKVTEPGNKLSYVFDLAPLGFEGARKFINLFCEKALLKNKKPLKVYIEEAHLFLPLQTSKENQNIVRLATVGRQYGWGLCIISQRPAQVNKDVLTQADLITAMKLGHPLDIMAIADIWEQSLNPEQCEKLIKRLPRQKAGQGILYSPEWLRPGKYDQIFKHEDVFLKQVQFRQKYTPHLANTPKFEPEADLKEVEIKKEDLKLAEKEGLKVKTDPENVDYKSSKRAEMTSKLFKFSLLVLGALGGFLGAEKLEKNTDFNNYINTLIGGGVAFYGNKNQTQTVEGLGLGMAGAGVTNLLRDKGYLKTLMEA